MYFSQPEYFLFGTSRESFPGWIWYCQFVPLSTLGCHRPWVKKANEKWPYVSNQGDNIKSGRIMFKSSTKSISCSTKRRKSRWGQVLLDIFNTIVIQNYKSDGGIWGDWEAPISRKSGSENGRYQPRPCCWLKLLAGSGSYVLTHKVQNNIHNMEFQSRENDKIVTSNRDPLVIVKNIRTCEMTNHVLFYQRRFNRDGYSLNNKDSYSIYEKIVRNMNWQPCPALGA